MDISELAKYWPQLKTLLAQYGLKAVKAIVLLYVGWKAINILKKVIKKAMDLKDMDTSLKLFLISLVNILLKIALFLSVTEVLGVKTTSFLAIFGAAGLAIGMSLQGALGNLAGGVMILVFRPFRVGDFIEAQGFSGEVKSIQIFCTILHTGDRKTIIIPNGKLSSSSIINYSKEPIRRADFVFGISYSDDFKKAKSLLQDLANSDPRIIQDMDKGIFVTDLGAHSVDIAMRVFVKSEDYWSLYRSMLEQVKETFDANDINFPFPTQELHITAKNPFS